MKRHHHIAVALLIVVIAWIAPRAAADEMRASWDCLPKQTLVAFHVPDAVGMLKELRQQTKLGKVILSQERFDGLERLIKEMDRDGWDQMTEDLGRFGLRPEDLPSIFAGPMGMALVAEPRKGREPLFVALAWFEPGADMADRLLKALGQAIEDQPEDQPRVKRFDIELGGRRIIHLIVPVTHSPRWREPEFPDGFEEMGDQQQDEVWQQMDEQQGPVAAEDRMHVLIARFAGRFVVAMTLPQNEDLLDDGLDEEDVPINFEQITGLERAKGVAARFLAAHHNDEGGEFAAKIMATPGLADAMPRGKVLFEMIASLEQLVPLLEVHGQDEAIRIVKILGVDRVGAGAARATLDGNVMRSGMFIEAPAPRTGVVKMIEQIPLQSQPVEWAPAGVVNYAHFSFHPGNAYGLLKEMAVKIAGPHVQQQFMMAETVPMMALGVELPDILDTLGPRYTFLEFEPKFPDADKMKQDPSVMLAMTAMGNVAFRRMALTVEAANEPLWRQLHDMLKQKLAQLQPGMAPIEVIDDEQGFAGIRTTQQAPVRFGAFVGRGHLVMALGDDVANQVLAALRNPPQGKQALRGADVVRQAGRMIKLQSGLAYQITDNDRYVPKMIMGAIEYWFNMINVEMGLAAAEGDSDELDEDEGVKFEQHGIDEAGKRKIEQLRAWFPTEDEWKGVFGVGVGQMRATDHGLVAESAAVLSVDE